MEPYYEDKAGRITLYCADCRDVLPTLEAGAVDLVLTDPPYNIGSPQRILFDNHGKAEQRRLVGKDFGSFDISAVEPLTWMPMARRVLKDGGVVVSFYDTKAMDRLLLADSGMEVVQDFHWCKPNPPVPMRSVGFSWGVESGYIFRKRATSHRHNNAAGISPNWRCEPRASNAELSGHPTQKPVGLMAWLIAHWSWLGELILDPFAGSGTTLVAAKQLGRRAIGIEICREYCDIAVQRLQQMVWVPEEAESMETQPALPGATNGA